MSDENGYREKDHNNVIATLYRLDPERLAAVRRAISGITRCPQCDAPNRADQPRCDSCGAKLYPEVPDNEEEKGLTEEMRRSGRR